MNILMCLAKEKRKKRLAFYQSSIVVSPESSPYYPPVLNRETDGDARYKKSINSPPKLRKESAALLSSPDSSPCVPPPVKKAKPLSFSDESPSSSQTSTASAAKPDVVDFKAVQQRVQFLAEAFPEIPRQVNVWCSLFISKVLIIVLATKQHFAMVCVKQGTPLK